MKSAAEELAEGLAVLVGGIVLVGLLIAGVVVVDGFVMKMVWNWFVPHIFHSAPHLGIGEAIGLALIPTAFWGQMDTKKKDKEREHGAIHAISMVLGRWGMILLMGWIIHSIIT